ncbi:hypothetical protein [Allobranchiibius sp. CTAmp26]|uniref:hypothetical protein n=1 Tax=Allobranchiibius sp. CTAmp26 TaxID=2815214 RepID=UPI001AA11ABB|nr:hypothetical protein [Allobranchiibius sp. CTAmp26]MBO1754800.1 hypothetical protein [Allobranchiibius sp. CTAmp26]
MSSFRVLSSLGTVALAAAVLAGCGSATSPGGSTTSASSPPSSSSTAPSSTAPSSSAGGSSSAKNVTLSGTVRGERLPCVRFHSADGHQYVISGAVPGKLYVVAHSGGSRSAITAQPSPAQIAKVTLVGHTVSGLMSQCGGTTFVVTAATIHSITAG